MAFHRENPTTKTRAFRSNGKGLSRTGKSRLLRSELLEKRELLTADLQVGVTSDFERQTSDESQNFRLPQSVDQVWTSLNQDYPVRLGPLESTAEALTINESPTSYVTALEFESFSIDHRELQATLGDLWKNAASESVVSFSIPNPNGQFDTFLIHRVSVMAPELALKYPEIMTFSGSDPSSGASLRMDVTPQGFHAMVRSPEGGYYVDPLYHGETDFYASFWMAGEFIVPEYTEEGTSI